MYIFKNHIFLLIFCSEMCFHMLYTGMDSDLLIHEATMEDELIHEAIAKMHSTTSQAVEIGKNMRAKYTLLTHFSQRYAKLPRFNENLSGNVGIAFDNMQVSFEYNFNFIMCSSVLQYLNK